ncbi:MAG: hypothetical protein Q9195_008516 [Heterodermia aff. obscurata]
MADPTTKPPKLRDQPDPTPSTSLRSRLFTITHRPKPIFKPRPPTKSPSPEAWAFVTRNYQSKDPSLRGNLPESMGGKDASRKLEWIDEMLQAEAAQEQGGEKWTSRVFWDRRREEIWRRAGGEVVR